MGDQLVTFDQLQQVGDVQQEEDRSQNRSLRDSPQAIGTTWWSVFARTVYQDIAVTRVISALLYVTTLTKILGNKNKVDHKVVLKVFKRRPLFSL